MTKWVSFVLDRQRYGLPLAGVERIVHAVEITPLPKAPEIVLGVINVSGRIVPVVDIRKRFGLAHREIGLNDHLIIGQAGRLTVALAADTSDGVLERSEEEVISAKTVLPGMQYLEGVAKLDDGMILLHDLNQFLALDEAQQIEEILGTQIEVVHGS